MGHIRQDPNGSALSIHISSHDSYHPKEFLNRKAEELAVFPALIAISGLWANPQPYKAPFNSLFQYDAILVLVLMKPLIAKGKWRVKPSIVSLP